MKVGWVRLLSYSSHIHTFSPAIGTHQVADPLMAFSTGIPDDSGVQIIAEYRQDQTQASTRTV